MRSRFGTTSIFGIIAFTMLVAPIAGTSRAVADPAPSPTASVDPSAPTGPATKTVTVDTLHFAYDPDPITIAAGTDVVFKNSDEVAHTVTSLDAGDKPAFDSGDMPQNKTWAHIFAKAGTYKYYCRYHTYMKGTIVVVAPK